MIRREAVLSALDPFERISERVVPRSSDLRLEFSDGALAFHQNGDSWPMSADAVYDTIRWVPGLGKAALREWPLDMALEVVNWWLRHGEEDVRLLLRDDEVISLPGPGAFLAPSRMIDVLCSAVDGDLEFESLLVRNGLVDLAAVARFVETDLAGSGRVFGGVNLRFRPDGTGSLELFPFLWREVCSNGLGTYHGFAERMFLESSAEAYDFVSASLPQVWGGVNDALDALEGLFDITVEPENLGGVVSDLMAKAKVPVRLRDQVLEAVAVEDDGTMFGVSQGFARAALSAGLPPSVVHRLRMAAGHPLEISDLCTSCRRPVGRPRRASVSVDYT